MSTSSEPLDMADVGLESMRLEELVDRAALRDMAASVQKLFGIPVRVYSAAGTMIAEACPELARPYLVGDPRPGVRIETLPIEYDQRLIGNVALGPFLDGDGDGNDGPPSAPARGLVRANAQLIRDIGEHIATILDLILFSGHKALLTSRMHIASINESYRELTVKNERLEDAYARLTELDRLKSNFLATVSHELRTPLTSIMGYGEMLAEGIAGQLNEEQLEFVETIRTKSEQLLGLIMSLLDLSKLESGGSVRLARTSLATALKEAVSTLAPTAKKKGIDLDLVVPNDLPPVLGDVDRLRQVFINLTENALKFTPTGGKVTLVASWHQEDPPDEPGLVLVAPTRKLLTVRVADTGHGIPEAERVKVFDPFYQIDQSSTREHGGTGLGLAIVKRLVDAHHGSIRIEENDPNGAVFVVTLPAARPSMPPSYG